MKPTVRLVIFTIALTMWVAPALAQRHSAPDTARSFGFLDGRIRVLQSAADTGGTAALLDLFIPANSGPPPHIHTREDEVYLIKRGTFQFFMDGICRQAGPGATFYMPKGHMHMFKNVANETGEQLLFVYPAGLEQFFREVHDLDLKMPQDFNKLNELSNRKYGINHEPGHDFHAGPCETIKALNEETAVQKSPQNTQTSDR
jgi:mannose-6-phosphate isomerase-like protein (cupin superfamily)